MRESGMLGLLVCLLIACVASLAASGPASAAFYESKTPIAIPAGQPGTTTGPASPYPSTIDVQGIPGSLLELTVVIDVQHTRPADIDALLVAPGGQKTLLMSDACGTTPLDLPHIFVFDDADPELLPNGSCYFQSGIYKPTDYSGEEVVTFPPPAPPAPYPVSLSALTGGSPNGTWRLYFNDDSLGMVGGVTYGWNLSILSSATCAGKTAFEASDVGTAGDDVIEGTPGADVIVGLGGNDAIDGVGGKDVICAGAGSDDVRGGAGNDRIFGGPGPDLLLGGRGRDVLRGEGGRDGLAGGAQRDVCVGGKGRDRFACEKTKS